ncbi:MAG: response regulator [Pseudomonadota bacterium]
MSMKRLRQTAQDRAVKLPEFVSILIVDDERYDRARLRRICDGLDFDSTISEADTLETMGSKLSADVFDLIFLDFNMPDGNGLLALDAIHYDERNRHAAVIMVTGDDDLEVALAAMRNGCADFVKKENLTVSEIRRTTVNALQKAALNRGLARESSSRAAVENALNAFTEQCVQEFNPMLYQMMRHVRSLQGARGDAEKFAKTVRKIEDSCERLFDFVKDIEDAERKDDVLAQVASVTLQNAQTAHRATRRSEKARLFGKPN